MKTKIILLLALLAQPALAIECRLAGTGSMEPRYHKGDRFDLNFFFPYARLEVGMFVARRGVVDKPWLLISHRIVARTVRHGVVYFITKGDANDWPDMGFMSEKNYVGLLTPITK